MSRGRPRTTGRCETRSELIETAWFLYDTTKLSVAGVARNLKISEATAHKILNERPVWVENFRRATA